MSRKLLPMTGIPDGFVLTDKTRATVESEYPTIDVDATLEKFRRKADAGGWMYKSWQSAFLNYCDNAQKYGGVVFRQGRAQDPLWVRVLNETRPYGFRMPHPHETPQSFRTSFESWKRDQRIDEPKVVEFGPALRGFK